MAEKPESNHDLLWIDPSNGYCSATKIFHSIRPTIPLPPLTQSMSSASYIFSLFLSSSFGSSISTSSPAIISSTTSRRISYSEYIDLIQTLSSSLTELYPSLCKGQTAFILSPPSINIPILYLSLLSLGVIVSPSNPANTPPEILRQIQISSPIIAFATSATAARLPRSLPIVLLDSTFFLSLLTSLPRGDASHQDQLLGPTSIAQSDPAAILYSSGTTGRTKGVVLTHRNLIAMAAGVNAKRKERATQVMTLTTVPLFHVYGFVYCLRAVVNGEAMVLAEGEGRFELGRMLKVVEEFKVTHLALSPPVVVAMAKRTVKPYNLSSLEFVISGGAPLGKEVIDRFKARLPNVQLAQGYGMTESAGAFEAVGEEETRRYGSVGRVVAYCEAKIVDPLTALALPPYTKGELWIRGPLIMKGYVADRAATAETLDPEGWLKTGDLCYIDGEGFLYVVDRLKELIKYKGYQVPPAELEHLLLSHLEIIEAAVIPYPDDVAGQVPMAFVVKRAQSSLKEAQVMAFVAKQVAPYKKIRHVSFINSIPKNAAGKMLRKDLVKLATSQPVSSSRL